MKIVNKTCKNLKKKRQISKFEIESANEGETLKNFNFFFFFSEFIISKICKKQSNKIQRKKKSQKKANNSHLKQPHEHD